MCFGKGLKLCTVESSILDFWPIQMVIVFMLYTVSLINMTMTFTHPSHGHDDFKFHQLTWRERDKEKRKERERERLTASHGISQGLSASHHVSQHLPASHGCFSISQCLMPCSQCFSSLSLCFTPNLQINTTIMHLLTLHYLSSMMCPCVSWCLSALQCISASQGLTPASETPESLSIIQHLGASHGTSGC